MQPLYHELGVLAKAVHFKNLSAAALHVGLSQSQLSRIIAKIEEELRVVLLDRSAKRKSGWTPVAMQLAEIFERNSKRMESEILTASHVDVAAELRIGSLEGLSGLGMKVARASFERLGVRTVHLDVYDLNELEANFLSGNLDLVFTSKPPGRQRFKHLEEIGYQQLEPIRTNRRFGVLSPFEASRAAKKELEEFPHVLVTNSLTVRREWFRSMGGTGLLPSEPRRGKSREFEPVYLVGSDVLSPVLWERVLQSAVPES